MNQPDEMLVITDDVPDANCHTLPDGSCVAPDPCMHTPTYGAENVEYDLKMPGGGTETIPAGQLEGTPDVELLARRRLMQLKMVTTLLKRQKRRAKLDEAKPNRIEKGRKKRDAQKASRKKNRGK